MDAKCREPDLADFVQRNTENVSRNTYSAGVVYELKVRFWTFFNTFRF